MARLNIIPVSGFAPAYPEYIETIDLPVASAFGQDIYPGDPLIAVTDGTVARTPAGTAAGAATDGISFICMDVIQFRDAVGGFIRRNGCRFLPSGTTYTADGDRSLLSCMPVTRDMLFRVRVTAAAATIAAARANSFLNADHIYTGADTGLGLSGARLNAATFAVTATLQWRIVKWEDNRPSNDPTQADWSCIVTPNLPFAWPIVGHSATGI